MTRAKYTYVGGNDTTVYIADLNIGMSVTNDAEGVVEDVINRFGSKRIVYRDSDGRWDELKHNGREFTDFGPAEEPAGLLH